MINRKKEFDPYAFKVFGPKLIASREPFQDQALESRFITEHTGVRALRADIAVHLPAGLGADALALRNRLLHFRFCEFFTIKTDSAALIDGAEPRLNQMALPLLSLVDDPATRARLQDALVAQNEEARFARHDTLEAAVLDATIAAFDTVSDGDVPLRLIADQFNAAQAKEYGIASNRRIGSILRTRLGLTTRKTRGTYIVPANERAKLPPLALRYGATQS
jgi:hypothetical protein